jgi:hypothetical protein
MGKAGNFIAPSGNFVFAGQKIEAIVFIVNTVAGEELLRVGLSGVTMNDSGEVIVRTLPVEARQIARELQHTADRLEIKEKIAKEMVYG